MEFNQHVQYFDPLLSQKENLSRAGFFRPGRYHGFDSIAWNVGSGNDKYYLRIFHSDSPDTGSVKITNSSNEVHNYGLLVLGHGVIATSIADESTDGVYMELPANGGEEDVFYVFLATYSWQDSPGGSPIEFHAQLWEPSDLDNPDPTEFEIGPMETLLGYFRIEPGAVDFPKAHLVPQPTPSFAGKHGLPSDLARTKHDNFFEAFQRFEEEASATYLPASQTLNLVSKSNVARLTWGGTLQVSNLNWNAPNTSILTLVLDQVIAFRFNPGGNIKISQPIDAFSGDTLTFYKTQSTYFLLSVGDSLLKKIQAVQASIPVVLPYGAWQSWFPDPDHVPAEMMVGAEPTFKFYFRTDGRGAYVCKASFQLSYTFGTSQGWNLILYPGSGPQPSLELGYPLPIQNAPAIAPIFRAPDSGHPGTDPFYTPVGYLSIHHNYFWVYLEADCNVGTYMTAEFLISPLGS